MGEETDKINRYIKKVNSELKAANIGLKIERFNSALYIRGSLPPKPDSELRGFHTQRIRLSALGIRANISGVQQAKYIALKIAGELARNEFAWFPYLPQNQPKIATCGELIQAFEEDYFNRKGHTPKTKTTFFSDYKQVFKRLPEDVPLSTVLIREIVLATPPNSKNRLRTCQKLKALARFAGLECDLSDLRGGYSQKRVVPKKLPSDEEISNWFGTFSDECWQWVYGAIATYGLRPHEVFFLDLSSSPAKVTEGKTGSRIVWPLYPEWEQEWSLRDGKPPKCTGNNKALGQRVGQYFRRHGIPFSPYCLRHAWAIRATRSGIAHTLAAKLMGHSLAVHFDVYHQHIQEHVFSEEFERFLSREDRPAPPKLKIDTDPALTLS